MTSSPASAASAPLGRQHPPLGRRVAQAPGQARSGSDHPGTTRPAHPLLRRTPAVALEERSAATPLPTQPAHQPLIRTPGVGPGGTSAPSTEPSRAHAALTRTLASPLDPHAAYTTPTPPTRMALARSPAVNPFDARRLPSDPGAHAPLSALNSNASTVSNSSVHSDLAYDVEDPDQPATPERSLGTPWARMDGPQRNLQNMSRDTRAMFDPLRPATGTLDTPAEQQALREDLERLRNMPLRSLLNERRQSRAQSQVPLEFARAVIVHRDVVTQRGGQMLERLKSPTAEQMLEDIRSWPDRDRANAIAALTWANMVEFELGKESPATARLIALCAENKHLSNHIDAYFQTLEYRHNNQDFQRGLRAGASRRAPESRLPYPVEAMLTTLGIREWRRDRPSPDTP
ncbi:hypothetical protein [Roseateles amylovorans]|uniref:Uncharacterized protein n=1 Tax=Roseateles amylovorans TaxID=2978473 RepID=A0ABY6B958_9BURK|nr:hypothetical protein [Roseateles amylovorans]UXH79762.1 hypothetical protein N4261_07675 [Roseateles amylovorans]